MVHGNMGKSGKFLSSAAKIHKEKRETSGTGKVNFSVQNSV